MVRRVLGVCLVLVVACKSGDKAAYERVAGELNTAIAELRPIAKSILAVKDEDLTVAMRVLDHLHGAKPDEDIEAVLHQAEEIRDACMNLGEPMWTLYSIDLKEVDFLSPKGHESKIYLISLAAEKLVDFYKQFCSKYRSPSGVLSCASGCRGAFAEINEGLTELEHDAGKANVHLETWRY